MKYSVKPEIIDVFGEQMVNVAYVMEQFKMNSASSVPPKMRSLNIRGTKFGNYKYYPLRNIQAALVRPLKRNM